MLDTQELRTVYCNLLMNALEKDDRICVLDADLMRADGILPFRDKYPEHAFDCGIAEANMIGVASGLATMGKIPFASSFCTFASRRCFDQVFISAAYAGLGVKIVGTDPGITAELNGGTHMSFEDYGIMRSIPEMTIVEPVDAAQLCGIFDQIKDHAGPVYVRLSRKKNEKIFADGTTFTVGKSKRIADGSDVTIFATGILVAEAVQACEMLKQDGISARVENMFTIKPIDQDAIVSAAKETGAIVTAENHNVVNGLASAVAEVLVAGHAVPMESVGVKDLFGQVGKRAFLAEYYGLLAKDIVAAAKKAVARK